METFFQLLLESNVTSFSYCHSNSKKLSINGAIVSTIPDSSWTDALPYQFS